MQATQKIEGYDSFEQIALGGMATVYKARQVSLDKPVAIKVLFPHLAQDGVYLERFKREAKTAASVQHDNIVNVVDYGESNESHYIVMEYYDGVTLEYLLENQSAMPLDICFAVLLNVCYGLEAAHAANLVHRDIKPANIILTRSGGVKIADFGLARTVDKPAAVTQHGKIIGTPAYMSPEQTRGDEIGTQSDIFSLGVVAYELICSCRPFDGRNYAQVVSMIQSEDPAPISGANPLAAAQFSNIISRMLAKNTDDRYGYVSEAVIDLEEAIDKSGYKRDRRTLGRYIKEPGEYLQSFNQKLLEQLRSNAPSLDADPQKLATHFRRILHLDASDKLAREQLVELGAEIPPRGEDRPEPATDASEASAEGSEAWRKKGYDPKTGKAYVIDDDPDADYRVYLDSIDLSRETPPSFALKLSMRIRSPLPRVMAIVKNMPAMVGGRLSLDKATRLSNVIENLGGVARLEVHPVNETTGGHRSRTSDVAAKAKADSTRRRRDKKGRAETARGPRPELGELPGRDGASDKTVEYHPINEQRSSLSENKSNVGEKRPDDVPLPQRQATRLCPKCGWEENADAKFCSICLFNFHKTEPLNLAALQSGDPPVNPLARNRNYSLPQTSVVDKLRELPTNVKYGGLAGLIVLLLLVIFGR
jgi:serine/threonine protein kinase